MLVTALRSAADVFEGDAKVCLFVDSPAAAASVSRRPGNPRVLTKLFFTHTMCLLPLPPVFHHCWLKRKMDGLAEVSAARAAAWRRSDVTPSSSCYCEPGAGR